MPRLLALKWQPDRRAWRALCAAAAAVVLFGAAGSALDVAWVPGWSSIDDSGAPPALVELTDHAVQRCPQCGWIESKREIVSSVADPRSLEIYEYTLRMADGSSRVFREALPASWRLGERLTVIDGTSAPLN